MTRDNAIPQLIDPSDRPGTGTRVYFDGGRAFGGRHARPATSESSQRTWHPDQLREAAASGAEGSAIQPDVLAALCKRYLEIDAKLRALSAAALIGDRLEANRLARLHADLVGLQALYQALSAENLILRRRVGQGSERATPEDPDAADTMQFAPPDDEDTQVVDVPLPPSGGAR